MKKRKVMVVLIASAMLCLAGCEQASTKYFGCDMTLQLEPNEKLEMITWKDDDSLWYLTRPMRENEEAETHVFKQKNELGVFEGTVTIKETKK